MNQFHDQDPELYKVNKGGGCLMLFGLPFFLSGIFTIFIPVVMDNKANSGEMIPVIIFGSIFSLVGFGIMFGRAGLVLDRRLNSVRSWWGILFPFSKQEYRLDEVQQVTLTKEVRRSKNSSYTVYPVRIIGEAGGEDFKINVKESRQYQESRRLGEELAKFVTRSLVDSSSGKTVVREHDKLDESVREKVRRLGKVTEIPPVPKETKLHCQIEGKEIEILIPPPGWHFIMWLPLAIGAIISGIFAINMRGFMNDAPIFFQVMAFLFLSFPLLGISFVLLKHASTQHLLEVTPKIFRATKSSPFGKKEEELSTDKIEELEIVTGQNFFGGNILARSDEKTVSFGTGLSSEELKWLYAVVENTISA